MIVTGVKKQEVEIEVDPQQFIIDLHSNWNVLNRMPVDAYIKNFHWYKDERQGHEWVEVPLRGATDTEIKQFEALLIVQDIASELD